MRVTRPVPIRQFLGRVIRESLRSRPHPGIQFLRRNYYRYMSEVYVKINDGSAAVNLICNTCIGMHKVGATPVQIADLIAKAQELAHSLPTFPWNERRLKSLALQDIGSAMHQIGWDRAETIGVLKESLREASLVDGAKWGNSEKTRVIREIKAQIQKAEKSS